jgi:protein-disulfide isomerase
VAVVFRDYPLPMHPEAPKAAEAASCANEQGKFWEMHDLLFANQRKLGNDDLKGYGKQLELDEAAFNTCLDSGKYAEDVKKDMADGSAVGVTGTPAFFINGRFLNGARPYEQFAEAIDAELEAKGLN